MGEGREKGREKRENVWGEYMEGLKRERVGRG